MEQLTALQRTRQYLNFVPIPPLAIYHAVISYRAECAERQCDRAIAVHTTAPIGGARLCAFQCMCIFACIRIGARWFVIVILVAALYLWLNAARRGIYACLPIINRMCPLQKINESVRAVFSVLVYMFVYTCR